MNRLQKLLAAATLLVLPVIAACGEDPVPPAATGSITGQVSIEGMGIDGVSVNLSNSASTTTAGGGTYRFDDVEAGAYTVTISGFPADASFDATSAAATIPETGGPVTLDFRGSYIRTASIMGTVTVENTGLGGVTVRLSGMADAQTATDNNGQYAFTGLRAGTYSVEISGFDMDEVGFGSVSSTATVGVGESRIVSFDGTYLRTAGIQGQVSVEGEGLAGVTVSLAGEGEEATTTTDVGGLYAFSKLRAGDYSVAISGYDTDDYEFETTSMNVSVALGETANVPFDGTLLRTSGISGLVSVEKNGVEGVTVTLSGTAEASTTTDANGLYAFTGLEAGDYTITVSGFDANAYSFDPASVDVTLADDDARIENFEGTHMRTANIMGYMYVDENPRDGAFDMTGEDALAAAGIPVLLQGPGVNDVMTTATGADGSYMFDDLQAGAYRILVNVGGAAEFPEGYAFAGNATGMLVAVGAGGSEAVHFPFHITHQNITVRAVLSDGTTEGPAVEGVSIDLYASFEDADSNNNVLGSETTDADGAVTFNFARLDDPDKLVFAKATGSGSDDLAITGNEIMEIQYAARNQASEASKKVHLLNMAANIQISVMNIATAVGGGVALDGWTVELMSGDIVESASSDDDGSASFTLSNDVNDLPVTYTVGLAEAQSQANGEAFSAAADAGSSLSYTHDGLSLPGMTHDLGVMRVRFTTQALHVAVHREIDDIMGYTDRTPGDEEPGAVDAAAISVRLVYRDENGFPQTYDGGADIAVNANPRSPNADGKVTFRNLPADMLFMVEATSNSADRRILHPFRVNTWGDQGGNVSGAFGENGGSGPVVNLCTLEMSTPPWASKGCSTFAYKWADGTVSGSVASADGSAVDSLAVSLTPDPDRNLQGSSAPGTVTGRAGTAGAFSFSGLQDGRYILRVSGDDAWEVGGTRKTVTILNGGDAPAAQAFTATYQMTSISGTVVNDISNDNRVTGADQVEAGVALMLHRIQLPDTMYVDDATTDADGAYDFTGLAEGTYFVRADGGDYYVAPPASGELSTTYLDQTVTSGALLPSWDHAAGTVTEGEADADFVLLYTDGSMSGTVTGGPTTVTVFRCATADPSGSACTTVDETVASVETDAYGDWSVDGLREGYYEVQITVSSAQTATPASRLVALLGRGPSAPGVNFTIN